MKILGLMLLVIGMSGAALAQQVPEVDASSAVGALCLLSGAIVLVRSRLKK